MAKKNEVERVHPQVPAAPDFMSDAPRGDEQLKNFVIPPRLKVVQKQASEELLAAFNVGDLIASPSNVLVAPMSVDSRNRPTDEGGAPVLFTPVLFYPEWCAWNPLELKGQAPVIRERSQDPSSDIARKSRDVKTRFEPHPDNPDLKIRYSEHLNFVVVLHDHELSGTPMMLSFARGEHGTGQRFASLIRMRKAPLYGCIFEMKVGARSNVKGTWCGLNITNPPEPPGPWVEKALFEDLRKVHEDFAELQRNATLRADYGDEKDEVDDVPSEF